MTLKPGLLVTQGHWQFELRQIVYDFKKTSQSRFVVTLALACTVSEI